MVTSKRSRVVRSLVSAAVLALAVPVLAQQSQSKPCDEGSRSDRAWSCEVRTQMVPMAGDALAVDASPNGGVAVHGWDRQEIQLEAKVSAQADTEAQARSLVGQVRILTDGGRIRAEGPTATDGASWSVSFDVKVPAQGNLDVQTKNGGVNIEDVQGRITFRTVNGGIRLRNVNGDVKGGTTNGGVDVQLDGSGWYGNGLDVETTNGGVRLTVSQQYSAHIEAETVHGGLRSDVPTTMQGEMKRSVNADLGNGGATIRLHTVNGGVHIARR